jgi:hypothetical protein
MFSDGGAEVKIIAGNPLLLLNCGVKGGEIMRIEFCMQDGGECLLAVDKEDPNDFIQTLASVNEVNIVVDKDTYLHGVITSTIYQYSMEDNERESIKIYITEFTKVNDEPKAKIQNKPYWL